MKLTAKNIVAATGAFAAAGLVVFIVVRAATARSGDLDPTDLIPEKNLKELRPRKAAGAPPAPNAPIDLLDLVEAPKDAVAGTWGFQDRALITSGIQWGRLELPCTPPAEYDLAFRVTRKRGVGSFHIGFVQDGRQGMIVLDSEEGRASFISLSTAPDPDNETQSFGKVLKWNRESRIAVSVRRDSTLVSVDGKPLVEWKGGASTLAFPAGWNVTHPKALFLGSWDSIFRIDEATLVPVTGSVTMLR